LIFGEGFGGDSQGIIIDHTRFYYETIPDFNKVEQRAHSYIGSFQNSCSNSSRNSCYACASGKLLAATGSKHKYCSPTDTTQSWYVNHVKQFHEQRQNVTVATLLNKDTLNSFTFSFWFRRTSYTNDPHGIVSVGKVVNVNYDANVLTFNVEGFNCTLVGTARIPNVYDKNDNLDWLHITVSVNVQQQIFQVLVHNSRSGTNRYVNAQINVKSLGNLQKLPVTWSLDTTNCDENLYSFEVSTFVFSPNWYPTDTALIQLYRIRRPVNCESKCKTICDKNTLCPATQRFLTQIDLPNRVFKQALPLFRNLTSYFGTGLLSSPTFDKYLFSFELNIPAIQTSTYNVNKNLLININNEVSNCNLDYSSVVPDRLVKYGVFSVELRGNSLRFFIGGSRANTYAAYYDFVFDSNNFKGITRINVEFYVNAKENFGKLIIFIDDLRASYEIKTVYPPQPLTSDVIIYTHPAVSSARINVHNPRFNFDFYYNVFKKTFASTYPSNLCRSKAHCEKCSIIPSSTAIFCDRCANGSKMINNLCLDESSFKK
jgi:hypothetical protein